MLVSSNRPFITGISRDAWTSHRGAAAAAWYEVRMTTDEARCRVVLIEDNAESAEAIALILKYMGGDVRVAGNGLDGIELVRVVLPHIVFVDITLPDLNGYEVCARIHAAIETTPLIIALSGWDGRQHDERASAAGFAAQVTKPPDSGELRKLMNMAMPPAA